MDRTRSSAEFQVPHWMRVCVHSFLILCIFAMHNVLAGDGDQLAAHHVNQSPTIQSDTATSPAAPHADVQLHSVWPGDGHGPLGQMSDCCGLLMLCLSMIMGLGVLLFIGRKVAERVLWQLPPPSLVRDVLRVSPFQGLTPLQRSSILRC